MSNVFPVTTKLNTVFTLAFKAPQSKPELIICGLISHYSSKSLMVNLDYEPILSSSIYVSTHSYPSS